MTTVSQLLLSLLVNAFWQIALLTGITAVCDWLLHRTPARYRHFLWVITLTACFCLPIFTSLPLFAEAFSQNQAPQFAQAGVPVKTDLEVAPIELSAPAQTSPEKGNPF